MNQGQIMQFQMMEEEANKLSQQLQLIENNLKEIDDIKNGLEEIEKKVTNQVNECREIFYKWRAFAT